MRIIINVDENGDVTTEVENRTAAGQTAPGVPGAPPVAGDPAQALDAGAAPTLSAEAADAAPEPAPVLEAGGALDAGAAPAESSFGTAPEESGLRSGRPAEPAPAASELTIEFDVDAGGAPAT
ncbi:MAG: hypothetical protein V3U44_03505 [Alphaproteobacteria bacterium]